MRRSQQFSRRAADQALVAALFFMMSVSSGIFALVAYLRHSPAGIVILAMISLAALVEASARTSRYLQLSKRAFREGMEEQGIWPRRSR